MSTNSRKIDKNCCVGDLQVDLLLPFRLFRILFAMLKLEFSVCYSDLESTACLFDYSKVI